MTQTTWEPVDNVIITDDIADMRAKYLEWNNAHHLLTIRVNGQEATFRLDRYALCRATPASVPVEAIRELCECIEIMAHAPAPSYREARLYLSDLDDVRQWLDSLEATK
jgi:hypothetical protein